MRAVATDHQDHIPEPNITRFLFADTRMAPVWLIVRLWLGYEWLVAALGKWVEGGWVGEGAGGAVKGFAQGAIAQTAGEHRFPSGAVHRQGHPALLLRSDASVEGFSEHLSVPAPA